MNPRNNATTWILAVFASDLSSNCKLVCAAMRTFMNDHTEMAWPSIGRLAAMTSLSESATRRALQETCRRNYLIHNGFSQIGTKRYEISFEGVSEVQGGVSGTGCTPDRGVSEVPHRGVRVTPELTKSDKYTSLAAQMWEKIQPLTKQKTYNAKAWSNDLRKLVEIDGYDEPTVRRIFNSAITDGFWKKNILSPAKLRKQFPRLHAEFTETTEVRYQ